MGVVVDPDIDLDAHAPHVPYFGFPAGAKNRHVRPEREPRALVVVAHRHHDNRVPVALCR